MDETGLWPETSAVDQHHIIEHQLAAATAPKLLNRPDKLDAAKKKKKKKKKTGLSALDEALEMRELAIEDRSHHRKQSKI
jgi:hypothetical protein